MDKTTFTAPIDHTIGNLHWTERKISDLILPDWNPRKINDREFKELVASLEQDVEFIKARPVIVSTRLSVKGTVVAGNMRVRAAKSLGWQTVPVVEARLTEAQEKEWSLKDNLHKGEWDFGKLVDFDLDFLQNVGLGEKELDRLLGMQRRTDDDAFDPEQAALDIQTPITKEVDLWQLGNHLLLCGDSTASDSYRRLFRDRRRQVSMVFTDPPYNMDYQGSGVSKREGIMNDKMPKEQFLSFLSAFISEAMPHVLGGWYVCMSPKEMNALKTAFESSGGHFQSFIIWVKQSFTLTGNDYQSQYEPILYGWNAETKDHYFIGWRDEPNVWENLEAMKAKHVDGKTVFRLGEYDIEIEGKVTGRIKRKHEETDIWRENRPLKSEEHPTMKPVALVERAIRASSKRGEIVLDPFLGSGTTLMASENLGRICYGIELDPRYCDVIVKRWEEKTGKKAQRITSEESV